MKTKEEKKIPSNEMEILMAFLIGIVVGLLTAYIGIGG